MSKSKLLQIEQGFAMLDALVSILIVTAFVLGSAQALVIAAAFKVKANQYSKVTTWIQENIEEARFETKINQLQPVVDDPNTSVNEELQACGQDSTSASNNGYAKLLKDRLLSVNDSIYLTQENTTFYALSSTSSRPNPNPDFGGKNIWLLRNATPSTNPPFNLLKLNYIAVRDDNGYPGNSSSDIIANFSTEVLPRAALKCP